MDPPETTKESVSAFAALAGVIVDRWTHGTNVGMARARKLLFYIKNKDGILKTDQPCLVVTSRLIIHFCYLSNNNIINYDMNN